MDSDIAKNIYGWRKEPLQFQPAGKKAIEPARGWGARFRRWRRGKHPIF